MIEILKFSEHGIQHLERPTKDAWINVVNPDAYEIKYLAEICKVKEVDYQEFKDDINSLQDMEEIPFMEKYRQEYFIITRTPHKLKSADPESKFKSAVEYITIPLGIMINKDYIITISFRENENLDTLKTKKFKHEKALVLLKLLLVSSKTYIRYLKEIDAKIKIIEEKFESVQRNKEISDLLDLKKSLVYFNTSLKSDQILLEKIARNKDFVNSEDDKDVIDDVIDENKQAIVVTAIYKNIISDATDLFNSVTSNNLNRTVKLLTSITVIVAIPTLVASLFGMNVIMPFGNAKYGFFIVLGISVLLSMIGSIVLWRKGLL